MISFILRYCQGGIQEQALEYRPTAGLNADSLSKIILKFLQDCALDLNNLLGQSYDGGTILSGVVSGFQKSCATKRSMAFTFMVLLIS